MVRPQVAFRALALAALVALCGCTPPAERPDAQATIETDEFNPDITVDGPAMIVNPLIGIRQTYGLVTYIDKRTHVATYVIEGTVSDVRGTLDIRAAHDDTATVLPVRPVLRDRHGNTVVDIVVSEAVLRARAATGYRVQVIASDLSVSELTISPAMIAAQFDGVARAFGELRAGS